jgi:hypothetical protein
MRFSVFVHTFVPAALALALTACLENEEEITIAPDGSATVIVRAKGRPGDLAEGYAVPLGGPWTTDDPSTLEWIRRLGPDTGSAVVRANLAALSDDAGTIRRDEDFELVVHGRFDSVRDLPRWYAPDSEPFRTAYLERRSDLRVEQKGRRTVYTFERRYGERAFDRTNTLSRMRRDLGKDLVAKVEDNGQMTLEERTRVVDSALKAIRAIPVSFANDALLAVYTHGDASLPAKAPARILARVRTAIEGSASRDDLESVAGALFPLDGPTNPDLAGLVLERIDTDVRATLRSSFASAIEAEGTSLETRNALSGELEWLLTARDHTEDLGDEFLVLRVRLPGPIVGGNYDDLEDGAAMWRMEGETLRDRERVLRVVSVVE